jgi:hypothetical protein
MAGLSDDQLPRSRLYELLVQVDRKLAVVESRVANIEEQMRKQISALEEQIQAYESRSSIIQYALIGIMAVAGITVLVLLLTGRL